jgi:hypothetical protein
MSAVLPPPAVDMRVLASPPFVSFSASVLVCTATVAVFVATSSELFHWFLVPVLVCGVLVVLDVFDWLTGIIDPFDLRGLIGLFGVHFFFLAPLLHVHWGHLMTEVTAPPDWRDWLGYMAMLNVVGLLVYRIGLGGRVAWDRHALGEGRASAEPQGRPVWTLNRRRFYLLLALVLPISGALQVAVYASYGGLQNYIAWATASLQNPGTDLNQNYNAAPLLGIMPSMGVLYMFSETLPLLALMGFGTFARQHPRCKSWAVLVPALAVFLALALLFGGLRGSRANVVWNLFLAVGILHFWVRPIPKRLIGLGLVFLVLFMYAYGLFKGAGLEAVQALESRDAHEAMVAKTRRPLAGVILEDFGRSDVQAFLLYRLTAPDCDFEYSMGRTYGVALSILVPRQLWPERPVNIVKDGTEAQFGMGTFEKIDTASSRVYGLAGEAMLNFGPVSVPIAFLVWGVIVGYIRRRPAVWHPEDARFLMYPMVLVLGLAAIVQDTEYQLFFAMKFGTVPFLVIWLASSRRWVARKEGDCEDRRRSGVPPRADANLPVRIETAAGDAGSADSAGHGLEPTKTIHRGERR